MARGKILVVDDEEDILELIEYNLRQNGYDVRTVSSGEEAIDQVRAYSPDLIVLDLMLPGMDGLDVCRTLKRDAVTAGIPILMLTARGEEVDIVTGLELGADDYMTKPFSPRVLLARIKALLRRKGAAAHGDKNLIRVHDLVIDTERFEASVGGNPLNLTRAEFKLLAYLAAKPGRVFSRDQIIDAVHGEAYVVTDRAVDVLVASLRKRLGARRDYIETVRGVGYRFRE